MAGTILQRDPEPGTDRAFVIELNEAPGEGIAFQSLEVSYINSRMQGPGQLQGSVLSLASKSCVDSSDVQPLTEVHACRYDECIKYHNAVNAPEDNPNSPLKNVLLSLVLVLFFLWIVVYAVSTRLKLF